MLFYCVLLYGLCLRFLLFSFRYFMCPRLPSSGNRMIGCLLLLLFYSFWLLRCFFIFFLVSCFIYVVEGGGFIDLPSLRYFTRLFYFV
uniref:Small ribosomal subunit protein uS12m n=1 Tax=Trypanoplasma borreli TaxID=5710 RepID=RT12_TRYBO|nr:RecName: Full=Small ribosomal subunit protein uS12m; AltName: Full=Ribosomal protein S12, mitochondrial [Trypanoplasma borreli]AAC13775.1 ribosomal protein S12 [Trypanoplasma borreli]